APLLDASLKRSQLTVRELADAFGTKTLEQFLGCPLWLRFQPAHDTGPHVIERIAPRSPVALRLRPGSMSGANLSLLPRGRKAAQEAVEVGIAMREDVQYLTLGQPCEVLLDGADLVEKS